MQASVFHLPVFVHQRGNAGIMRGHHQRRAGARKRSEKRLHDALPGGMIELPSRLVGENDLWPCHHGASQRDALHLATRQLVGKFFAQIG